ncbi:MAG: HAD family phosphatase [Anaerolineae bacterium]|nr:HAD family phosphatase [Anaerolineae bacterium]
MPRALILDFDGVIAHTEPVHFAAWNQAFYELHRLRLDGDHRQLTGLSLQDIYRLWLSSNGREDDLSDEHKRALLARKTELFFELAAGHLQPLPGSLELIQQAVDAGWYVTVASRALRWRLHRTLELIGMPALFTIVLGSEDIVDPVTDRKVHARIAQMLDLDPANCVVIEDSASGIAEAVACGIGRVIGLTSSFDAEVLRQAGAHEVVDQLAAVQLTAITEDT